MEQPKEPPIKGKNALPGRVYMTKWDTKGELNLIKHWVLIVHFPTNNSWITLDAIKSAAGRMDVVYKETLEKPKGDLNDVDPKIILIDTMSTYPRLSDKFSFSHYSTTDLKKIKYVMISKNQLRYFVDKTCHNQYSLNFNLYRSWPMAGIKMLMMFEIDEKTYKNFTSKDSKSCGSEKPDDIVKKKKKGEQQSEASSSYNMVPMNPEDKDALPGRVYMIIRSVENMSNLIQHWALVVHFPTANLWLTLEAFKTPKGRLEAVYKENIEKPEGDLIDVDPIQILSVGMNGFSRLLMKFTTTYYRAKKIKQIKHIMISVNQLRHFVKETNNGAYSLCFNNCQSWAKRGIEKLRNFQINELSFYKQLAEKEQKKVMAKEPWITAEKVQKKRKRVIAKWMTPRMVHQVKKSIKKNFAPNRRKIRGCKAAKISFVT